MAKTVAAKKTEKCKIIPVDANVRTIARSFIFQQHYCFSGK